MPARTPATNTPTSANTPATNTPRAPAIPSPQLPAPQTSRRPRFRLPWRTYPVDPNDPRYPRKPLVRWVRRGFEYLWLLIVAYYGLVASNVVGVLANPGTITPESIIDALDLGRAYQLVKPNLVLAGLTATLALALAVVVPVALLIAAYLAWSDAQREKDVLAAREKAKATAAAGRAEVARLAPYYKLKPVSQLDPNPPANDVQLAKYVPNVYLDRRIAGTQESADATARAALEQALAAARATSATGPDPAAKAGILIVGRPTLGKTRCAFEAMRTVLPTATFVSWPHGEHPPFDFTLVAGQTVVLWLDNLHEFANDRDAQELNELPGRFAASPLVIVATCRDGEDLDRIAPLKSLTDRLTTITLDSITPQETNTLATELAHAHATVVRGAQDGTPGALLLDVEGMTGRYKAATFPPNARAILKAMKLLRSAGTYDYPAARVRALAHARFALPDDTGTWENTVDVLEKQDFVRRAPSSLPDPLNALVPLADVYLERAVPDYPTTGKHLSDDWPTLAGVLEDTRDTYALFQLGYTSSTLTTGLDPAKPWDLLAARQLAERCYRAFLDLTPPDNVDRPAAQSNLGNVLSDLATLATDDERRQTLRQEAEAAHRASIAATIPGSAIWANGQNNLGLVLNARAAAATNDDERRTLLRDAETAYRAALSASAPGTILWASRQSNLGSVLRDQAAVATANDERLRLLTEAVDACQAALSATLPGTADWASRQSTLSTTLVAQATLAPPAAAAERQTLLRAAIDAAQAALSASTPGTAAWAIYQSALGAALGAQAALASDDDDNEQPTLLRAAEAAYRAALSATTPGTAEWANLQSTLGSVLALRAAAADDDDDERALLREAEAAQRAAVEATTPGTLAWATRQFNLATLYWTREEVDDDDAVACADLAEALRCLNLADAVFTQGLPVFHEQVASLRQAIHDDQVKRGCTE